MIKNIYKVNIKGVSYGIIDSNNVARVEEYDQATVEYEKGEYLIWDQQLYKVIADIKIGDEFVINTNVKSTMVGDELSAIDPDKIDERFDRTNSNIADIETHATRASKAYEKDDCIIWNDICYKVTKKIAINELLVVGENLEETNAIEELKTTTSALKTLLEEKIENLDDAKVDIDQSDSNAYKIMVTDDKGKIKPNNSKLTPSRLMTTDSNGIPIALNYLTPNKLLATDSNGMPVALSNPVGSVGVHNSTTNVSGTNDHIQVSTSNLKAGSSMLTTGRIYMVYE